MNLVIVMIFVSQCYVCNSELSEHTLIVIVCYYSSLSSYKQNKHYQCYYKY